MNNKEKIKEIFREFQDEYDFEKLKQIWKNQSEEFRKFWEDKILNENYPELSESDMNYVIKFFDEKARGAKEFRENGGLHAARANIFQGQWYRALKSIKNNQDIKGILDDILKTNDDDIKVKLVNKLKEVNEKYKNGLTGKKAIILNAILFTYSSDEYVSMLSLEHRFTLIEFFDFGKREKYESYGEQIVNTNRDIISSFKDKFDINIPAHLLSYFIYNRLEKILHWNSQDLTNNEEELDNEDDEDYTPWGKDPATNELEDLDKSLQSEEKKQVKKIKRAEKEKIIQAIKGKGEDIFETTEQEQPLTIPQEEKRVVWQPKDYSIRELFEMFKDGELHLQPKFQRLHVWDKKKAYKLIESIFLDVPIPVIYLAEEENGVFTVIDGQQRLRSFFDFMDGRLKIKGLLVLTELSDKKFTELSTEQKSKFKKATIHTIVIKKESQEDIRFEIFERLNTGSVQLNNQELRNCMFRGNYNELLEDLAKDKTFLSLLGLKEPHKRMMDRETILRFFTFYHSTYLRYEPPMKTFLNNEMRKFLSLDERETERLRKLFKKSVDLTKTVFGENSFRRFIPGSETDTNGVWERKKINKALFDIVMYGFTNYEKHQIVPRSDAIREELIWLMTHDQSFIDSIMLGTSDKSKVLTRFEKWLENLREIVGYPHKEPRAFSLELKAELHRSNPTCGICGQRIQVLDDSEVDHIDFYWRGGKTTPSNARLVHRYCNRQRGGRD